MSDDVEYQLPEHGRARGPEARLLEAFVRECGLVGARRVLSAPAATGAGPGAGSSARAGQVAAVPAAPRGPSLVPNPAWLTWP